MFGIKIFSSRLQDYIYIPLGGGRKGRLSKCVNLLVTFAVSGIWHGAGDKYLEYRTIRKKENDTGQPTGEIRPAVFRREIFHYFHKYLRKCFLRSPPFSYTMEKKGENDEIPKIFKG